MTRFCPRKWAIYSTAQLENLPLSDDDKKTWEACRRALTPYSFSLEEVDKILGKAFGHVHSPYWSEERKKEVPKFEIVNEILGNVPELPNNNSTMKKLDPKTAIASRPLYTVLHILIIATTLTSAEIPTSTSIIFKTLGRSKYAFDIFTLPTPHNHHHPLTAADELQLTDGNSVNFNGHFPSSSSRIIHTRQDPPSLELVYVTERQNGISNIYYDAVYFNHDYENSLQRRVVDSRVQLPLLSSEQRNGTVVSMKDRPSVTGEFLVYVSTHEDPGRPRESWAAVYSTELKTGVTRRLTPYGVADFSPSVSPSGVYTAVASYGEKGWNGDVEELMTDIYVFLTRDGTRRVKVVEHGGWPCWADECTLYFHRRGGDGWWGVYRAVLSSEGTAESVLVQRVTPPGLHAFTPATSPGNSKFIAVATRRPSSDFRHIELFDLVNDEFTELTRLVSPYSHHYNPFISPDSGFVGYHKCRGDSDGRKSPNFFLENVVNPLPEISLFRVDGSFPSFSPSGDRIAYVEMPGLFVINLDGSNRREVFTGMAFSTAWDPLREGVVYTSVGPTFASESSEVDIVAINVDDEKLRYRKLTTNGENNAFPWPSPDGRYIVFRSGRSGHKNLYIMDAVEGEAGGLYQLTKGPWSDTMCNWSPDGEWIAFASDRDDPGSGSFEMYLIHPNGTGLRKLIQSGMGGRTNHPYFSPNGKTIVFTSDYAGVSAEPISNPHHYQPYGETFTINLDGTGLKRLTHNSYEDGTPAWGSKYTKPVDVPWLNYKKHCAFDDCHWLSEMPNQSIAVTSSWYSSANPQPMCGF